MDMRIYRNYMSVLVDLCQQHNMAESLPTLKKLYTLLVLSRLFPRSAGVVASELIDLVANVDRFGDYITGQP